MDRFVVHPGDPLDGVIRVGGAKNSALKLMAACLLAEGTHRLSNVPRIVDVDIMTEVLHALGAVVGRKTDGDLMIESPAPSTLNPEAPYELVERMRASIVVLGPLLARCGHARVSMPGGDDFGNRPIDIHLNGLGSLGAQFEVSHGYVEGRVGNEESSNTTRRERSSIPRMVGGRAVLEYPSHTATDNLLMAAVLAEGSTVIENAAREPEVCDLVNFLRSMGAIIRGEGTSRIEVDGVQELRAAEHAVIPDRVVAATYLAAVGLAGGEVVIEEARFDHMEMLIRKLDAMGVHVDRLPDGLRATSNGTLRSSDIATLPYPGVATDYKPLLVVMLAVANGVGIVTENLFAGRFRYVDELRRMGADIRTEGHHAVVRGVSRLSGAPVRAPDIRAGAALVLAGLVAEGETEVAGGHHIDRGYEDLSGALCALGATVTRR